MPKTFLTSLIFALLFASCKSADATAQGTEAYAYLNEVLGVLEANSVNRETIDWKNFRQKVFAKAGDAETVADTYPSIQYAIKLLGDGHSYFLPVNYVAGEEESGEPPVLQDEAVPEGIGYIRVRYCMGTPAQKQAYTDALLNDIRQRDKDCLKGWIVDLRGNFGGDMTPMLLGAGPLLGNGCDGIVGYTAYPGARIVPWEYKEGKIYYGGIIDSTITTEKYNLKKPFPYVAVLTDTLTASSGEAVTVAFNGRSKCRSFGQHTYGVPTANEKFVFSDGSHILLTVGLFTNRLGKSYDSPVHPSKETDQAQTLREAIKWIEEQQ